MKLKAILLCLVITTSFINHSFAWGPEGHTIVGNIAMRYVTDDVRQNVLKLLDGMPMDTATNWMDIMKSNQDYEFMRPWHYVDFDKGTNYERGNTENLLCRLELIYSELKHKETLSDAQIKTDLLMMLHLMGDLHMPLHTGYEDDLGGNKVTVQYDTLKTHNLHWFWDEDIIRLTHITDSLCLQHYNKGFADSLKRVDFEAWVYDSRSLLGGVYDFPDFKLNEEYLQKNKTVVEKQLLKAGLRLALVLNRLFASPAPLLDFEKLNKSYANGMNAKDAMNNMGKKVTVCAHVYGVKTGPAVTMISLGARYPDNPLTVIIFKSAYAKFDIPFDELYKNKNISVKGKIEENKGKAQIIINDPEEIIFL